MNLSPDSPRTNPPPEELTILVYELLDAHADTTRLAAQLRADPPWDSHLDYLCHLQRVGREVLARETAKPARPQRSVRKA